MNKALTIFSLLFILSGPLYCQPAEEEKELDQIRHWYTEINANVDQFKKVELSDVDVYREVNSDTNSIEGAEIYRLAAANIAKFLEDGEPVKIVVAFHGDREELVSDYYFREGSLFFIDKSKTIYHKPTWHDKFDESDKSILRNRFYFKDDSLLRWINTDIQPVSEMDPCFKKHESTILSDVRLYLSI